MSREKQTYNPCDDCQYSYSKNNQESGMCKICEFPYFRDRKQSEGEWISVEERLPESLQRVLAINTEGDMFTAVYISFVTGKNAWSTSYSCLGVVTHWMPLPEPPKGDVS